MVSVNVAIEHLEEAKDELYSLGLEYQYNNKWELAELLEDYIASVQLIIDNLTDNEQLNKRREQ